MLLHRLEERRLRARRRAVDLVGQQDVGEHGAFDEPEAAMAAHRILFHDLCPGDVAGDQVRRELHALKCEVGRVGDRAHE